MYLDLLNSTKLHVSNIPHSGKFSEGLERSIQMYWVKIFEGLTFERMVRLNKIKYT